jgi:phosphoenolpyruvate synthase/pyruvate phosphate dikinase
LKVAGINPDDFILDKKNKLPISLFLLEADPSHDPLMRLVNAVITIRGGETCHAAIFCRE